jgi:phosphatidylinositol-3-phosphatase
MLRFTSPLFLAAALLLCGHQILSAQTMPRPSHVVIVVEENHSYSEIINSPQAPFINTLASGGALFTSSYAVAHPSQPNYLALFSSSTQGITNDSCPHTFGGSNLAHQLLISNKTFKAYSEGLPYAGSKVCVSGAYVRKHAPWTDFSDLPSAVNQPLTSFPTNYANLPTVSFVIPDLLNDMHDGTIQQADSWLQAKLLGYVQWAKTNNSLLIITWDEDDTSSSNHIPTIFVGPMVKPGKYGQKITHYNVLRTLEAMYGLAYLGYASNVLTITNVWQ